MQGNIVWGTIAAGHAIRLLRKGGETMQRSTDRILTTHVGSMPRPRDIQEMMWARQHNRPVDQQAFVVCVRSAVAEVVRRQVECGIDIVTDGEQSKASFSAYAYECLMGFEPPQAA
jgi:5-methyltetrahydropteroyltriglutamate--homocysteine methyltransferase